MKARLEREYEQKRLGTAKRSLHEQQAFVMDVMAYMRKRSCTPSENKARVMLMAYCKTKIQKISGEINDLNTRIWKLVEESKKDLIE